MDLKRFQSRRLDAEFRKSIANYNISKGGYPYRYCKICTSKGLNTSEYLWFHVKDHKYKMNPKDFIEAIKFKNNDNICDDCIEDLELNVLMIEFC